MKTLFVLLICALLAGCGDVDYVSPEEYKLRAEKAWQISLGRIEPTIWDYQTLDVAPVVNGISRPDGVIDVGDVVVLLQRSIN